MFGVNDKDLEERLAALERRLTARIDGVADELRALVDDRIDRLKAELAADPEERTRALVNAAAETVRTDLERTIAEAALLRERTSELEQAQRALSERLSGGGLPPWRTNARLNHVYRADVHAYVSIYYVGGRTDRVSLLIGDEDPPTKSYGELNVSGDINSYIGGLVRPGEYWTARAQRGNPSVKCVVTPLY